MKALLVLILAAAVGIAAYQYEPQLGAWLGLNMKPTPPLVQAPVVVEVPKVSVKVEPKKEAPKPKSETKMEEPKPVAPPPLPAPTKPKEGEFVAPTFPSIDERTSNWTAIPANMFPRQVKCSKDISLKGKVGGTTVPAGNPIWAISANGANLVVAPAPASPFRGEISIDDCDFKAIVTGIYKGFVTQQVALAKAKFDQDRMAKANPAAAAKPKGITGDPQPTKDGDGAYPWLLASMGAGEVTEIKKDNIKAWGDAKKQKVDGKDVWVVEVTFEAKTPFGNFETIAAAHVKDGQVLKWLYRDTGEVVP
jgi:hypothetical protein